MALCLRTVFALLFRHYALRFYFFISPFHYILSYRFCYTVNIPTCNSMVPNFPNFRAPAFLALTSLSRSLVLLLFYSSINYAYTYTYTHALSPLLLLLLFALDFF